MKRSISFVVAAGLVATLCSISTAAENIVPNESTPIGVSKIDITPETPVQMYGYASRKTESEGVAGRLSAKALVFGGDETPGPAVLLSVDCGAVPRDLYDEVFRRVNAKTPIAKSRFLLCNSHCHSGPNLKGMADYKGIEFEHLKAYAKLMADRLVQVVDQAMKNREPATLSIARGSVGIAANRRVLTDGKWSGFGAVPDAPADHELAVLKVTSTSGKVMALIANYACHNTTLRGNYMKIHGDWAGSAQRFLSAELPGTTTLISIGCGADSDPCPHGTTELCDKHGRAFADEVKRLLTGTWKPLPATIVAKGTYVEIPWCKPRDMKAVSENAKKSWAVAHLIKDLKKGRALPEPRSIQVNTWTFGDQLAMVFFTDEFVVDYVIRLKKEFDADRLWVSAYTNDVSTYVASPRVIKEGGYEARNSLSSVVTFGQPETLDPPMIERIVDTVTLLLPATFRAK